MVFKCMLLLYYKNGRGHNYRKQVTYFIEFKFLYAYAYNFLPSYVSFYIYLKSFAFTGSNANSGGVFADIVSCLVANTCLASFLFKERIWKLFFITNHRVIFNRQADNSSMEGMLSFM